VIGTSAAQAAAFRASLSRDVSASLAIPLQRVRVTALVAGSIRATVEIAAAPDGSQPSPQTCARALASQAGDPSSPVRKRIASLVSVRVLGATGGDTEVEAVAGQAGKGSDSGQERGISEPGKKARQQEASDYLELVRSFMGNGRPSSGSKGGSSGVPTRYGTMSAVVSGGAGGWCIAGKRKRKGKRKRQWKRRWWWCPSVFCVWGGLGVRGCVAVCGMEAEAEEEVEEEEELVAVWGCLWDVAVWLCLLLVSLGRNTTTLLLLECRWIGSRWGGGREEPPDTWHAGSTLCAE